jgi:hypothetical protein
MPNKYPYLLGALSGKGSSTRKFNFCQTTNPQPWTCLDEFLPINSSIGPTPPTPTPDPIPGKMKTVFLLELTAGYTENDVSIKNTINYYWNNYPQEFTKCPIVDTEGSLDITLSLLDEYYGYGFRYFIGFSRSTIVNGVLSWFNLHADAIGISSTSTATSLNIPKNIFRMIANDTYSIDSIRTFLENKTVNYIYSANEYAATDLIPYIEAISGITLLQYPIQNNSDIDALTFLNTGHTGEVMLCYLITNNSRQYYLDLFLDSNPILTYTNTQYDILGITTPIIKDSSALNNNYNTTTFKGINTSILWRNGYNSLGATNFSTVTPNILNMLNQFANNESIDNINSHYGPLIFNPVTKDIDFYSFLIEQYNGTKFINTNLYVKDPYLGDFVSTFVTNTPVSTDIITISPKSSFNGKALGLFDLLAGNQSDYISYQSLYYFWSKDSSLPKFPTVDISNLSSSQVADLLTSYYNQEYRLFLGPNFAFTLATSDILNWFASHPDAICINLFSSATIPNIPSNIYRLNPKASEILSLLISKIIESAKVYYIYDADDILGQNVNFILAGFCSNTGKTYKSFAIDSTHSNLTVPNMLEFFGIEPNNNPATIYDTNVIVSNSNLQNYLNLYSDVSMNQIVCPQYIGTSQIDPTIPVEGTVLNENLYTLDITYPSSSYLWNENRLFLTNKYSSNTDSRQLLNALKMMQYILAGKDIKLLGSNLGTLQFSAIDNNIIFPSVLIQQYQSLSNKFVNYEIDFTDPLLGVFTGTFV